MICTGSKAPDWLANSGLPVDSLGRTLTSNTLQVIGNQSIFASGDCGVIRNQPRPPAGVWAVRAAKPLAKNIERLCVNNNLKEWHPQKTSLQLIGYQSSYQVSYAVACFYGCIFGPYRFLWNLKEYILLIVRMEGLKMKMNVWIILVKF